MSSKENDNPDKLSGHFAVLSIDELKENVQPCSVDDDKQGSSSNTINLLSIELWVKILEMVLMEDVGDERHIKLSKLIRYVSQICRFTWYARLNKYLYATIDMTTGFVMEKQSDVLAAYGNCNTIKSRLLKFGNSGPNYEAATTIIDNILSIRGKNLRRVHFVPNLRRSYLSSRLSHSTILALATLGRLTHLHVQYYDISYVTIVHLLLDRPEAVHLVSLKLTSCDNSDSGDVRIAMTDFGKCTNLTTLDISFMDYVSFDLDFIIAHLPKLQHFSAYLINSIAIHFVGRYPEAQSTALRTLELLADLRNEWNVPANDLLRACPHLERVIINGFVSGIIEHMPLDVDALFDGCTQLKFVDAHYVDLTAPSLSTWPPMLEEIRVIDTNVDDFIGGIGLMAERVQRDGGRPLPLHTLDLSLSSSHAESLRLCLTHLPLLTTLNLDHHMSIAKEYQREYKGRDDIDKLLEVLDTIYIPEEDWV